MRRLRNTTLAAVLCLLAASPVSALSADDEGADSGADTGEEVRELARESIEKLLRAMELLLDAIPQYEAPEITEEGDIIIRRKRDPAPAPEQEET